MLKKYLRYFISLAILLHCTGATQLVSAYSKDCNTFASMLSMTEEETKKEKDDKDNNEYGNSLKQSPLSSATNYTTACFIYYCSKHCIHHQHLVESPTPPPDLRG